MQKTKKILFLLFTTIFLISPFMSVHAGIVPCGNGGEVGDACTICDLAKGIDNIVSTLMGWISIVAVVIIVVAGILYIVSAGNPGMISMAKTALKNTLIGLAIALSAFVLIHFVLKAMAVNNTGPMKGQGGNTWTFNC